MNHYRLRVMNRRPDEIRQRTPCECVPSRYPRDTPSTVQPDHGKEGRETAIEFRGIEPAPTTTPADLATRPSTRCTPWGTWPLGSRAACPPRRCDFFSGRCWVRTSDLLLVREETGVSECCGR